MARSGHSSKRRCQLGADSVAKVFLSHRSQIFRTIGAVIQHEKLARGAQDKERATSQKLNAAIAVIGIDIGKDSFHIVGHDHRGAIVLRQKWSRGQVKTRLANLPP